MLIKVKTKFEESDYIMIKEQTNEKQITLNVTEYQLPKVYFEVCFLYIL